MFVAISAGFSSDIWVLNNEAFLQSKGYSFRLKENKNLSLFQYDSVGSDIKDFNEGKLYLETKSDNKYFIVQGVEKKEINPSESEEFLKKYWETSMGGYYYETEGFPKTTYFFENIKTGSKSEYTTRGSLISIIDGFFYFSEASKKVFYKLDANFEVVDKKEYAAKHFHYNTNEDFLFLYLKDDNAVVEVFDLKLFKTVASIESTAEKVAIIFPFAETDGVTAFCCNDQMYTWNGSQLENPFPDKRVYQFYSKGAFVYITFEDDSYMYAYSPDAKQCILRRQSIIDGFRFLQFYSRGDTNFALFRPNKLSFIGGPCYFVSWKDEEFFKDEPWQAKIEKAIFVEEQIPDGDNFSICMHIETVEDYATVARQSLAALDQAIYKHANYYLGKPHSVKFTGAIELRFEKSQQLTKVQKDQLTEANEQLLDEYGSFVGPATGEACSLIITFAD